MIVGIFAWMQQCTSASFHVAAWSPLMLTLTMGGLCRPYRLLNGWRGFEGSGGDSLHPELGHMKW